MIVRYAETCQEVPRRNRKKFFAAFFDARCETRAMTDQPSKPPLPQTVGAMVMRHIAPELVPAHVKRFDGRFDELWIVEDCFYAGGISQLTAVLNTTSQSKIGHGIAPGPFRNPAALAMEWATLARLHPGRLLCGVGHGVDYWMRQIGEEVDSPITLMRETVTTTGQLLAAETVSIDGRYVQLDEVTLEFPPAEPLHISLGVRGPVSLRLAGEIADGTIVGEGIAPHEIAGIRETIEEGQATGNRRNHHRITAFVGFFVGDPANLPPPPADIVPGWAAVGQPDEVAAGCQEMLDAGIDSLIFVPFGDPDPQLELAHEMIVPLLKLRS